ncbi:MAG: hypothetical protein R3Y58_09095 [Eubacteriales bacterium]
MVDLKALLVLRLYSDNQTSDMVKILIKFTTKLYFYVYPMLLETKAT